MKPSWIKEEFSLENHHIQPTYPFFAVDGINSDKLSFGDKISLNWFVIDFLNVFRIENFVIQSRWKFQGDLKQRYVWENE